MNRKIAGSRVVGAAIVAVCLPLGCGGGAAPESRPALNAVGRIARDPGEILLGVRVGDDTVGVQVYFRRDGVVLCDSTQNAATGITFENSYDGHDIDILRVTERVGLRRSSDERLGALGLQEGSQHGSAGTPGRAVGALGSALYLAEQAGGDLGIAREALRAVVGASDTLAIAYVPRLHIEQFMQGRWTSLSRYADGLESFRLAPEETIRLRVQVRALKAVYHHDRVTIAAMPRAEEMTLAAAIGRPNLSRPDWVRPAGPTIIGVGDGSFLEWEFARRYFFSGFSFSVSVRERISEGGQSGAPIARSGALFKVNGPSMRDWNGFPSDSLLSKWPLVPDPETVSGVASRGDEFPGRGLYPRWAAERLKSWGSPYWSPGVASSEYRAYGPLREYIAAMVQRHDLIMERDGPEAADSFWRTVMDFSGSDSLKALNWLKGNGQPDSLMTPAAPKPRSRDSQGGDRPHVRTARPRNR